MTKLADILNDYYATEGFSVEELVTDAESVLSKEELGEEYAKVLRHLDKIIQ